jgi:hypothetical protein
MSETQTPGYLNEVDQSIMILDSPTNQSKAELYTTMELKHKSSFESP